MTVRAHLDCGPLTVAVWHAQGDGHDNQDRWLVHPLSTGPLRLAAIDGVTPWQSPPAPADPGRWAAATVARWLLTGIPVADAYREANRELHDPALPVDHRQVQAAAATVDCAAVPAGVHAVGLVAADAEVWAAGPDGILHPAVTGDHALTTVRAALDVIDAVVGDDHRTRREVHAAVLADPDRHRRHAVGRFPAPRFTPVDVTATTVVVASDGAHLAGAAAAGGTVTDLDEWLTGRAGAAGRDDLTCLTVTTAPA